LGPEKGKNGKKGRAGDKKRCRQKKEELKALSIAWTGGEKNGLQTPKGDLEEGGEFMMGKGGAGTGGKRARGKSNSINCTWSQTEKERGRAI